MERIGDVPIELPLVVGTCVATRAERAALAEGDVLVVPEGGVVPAGGTPAATPVTYTVVRGEKDVRISVAGPDRFATWSLGARPAVAPPATS